MDCRIDAQGNIIAENGNQSILYSNLLKETGDPKIAKDLYVLSETPTFKNEVTSVLKNAHKRSVAQSLDNIKPKNASFTIQGQEIPFSSLKYRVVEKNGYRTIQQYADLVAGVGVSPQIKNGEDLIKLLKNSENAPKVQEGRFLNKAQRDDLKKEVEANYVKSGGNIFQKNDIRMNIYNYENPMYGSSVTGVDIRVAQGLKRDKKISYILYADGEMYGEFSSLDYLKKITSYLENYSKTKDNKEPILLGRLRTEPYKDGYAINSSLLTANTPKGQGLGTELYKMAIKDAMKRDVPLYSDASQTQDAQRVWDKLGVQKEDSGRYKVNNNPQSFDSNGEVDQYSVLRYAINQKATKQPLNFQEQIETLGTLLSTQTDSTEELYVLLERSFFRNGMFNPTKTSLLSSGLYSAYEADNILNDISLQESIKNAIERLKNTPTIQNSAQEGVPMEYVQKSAEVDIYGKLKMTNPYIEEQTIIQQYGGTDGQGVENSRIDIADLQNYKRLPVLDNSLQPLVEKHIQPSVIQVAQNTNLIQDIEFLQNLDPIVQQSEEAQDYIQTVEKSFAKLGIDLQGLSTFPGYMDVLLPAKEFLLNPSVENTQALEDAHNILYGVNVVQKENVTKIGNKSYTLLYSETKASEDQLYREQGLIKTGETNILHKVQKLPLIQLKGLLSEQFESSEAMEQYLEGQLPNINGQEFAEDIIIQKRLFGHPIKAPVQKQASNYKEKQDNFNGNQEKLTEEFPAKFWAKALVEKLKGSAIYSTFYSKFGVNEKGLHLKSNDPHSIQQIKMYIAQNEVQNSVDIAQYSMLNKQMPLLVEMQETEPFYTKQQRRIEVTNNPESLAVTNKPYKQLSKSVLSVKNGSEDFVKTPWGQIYELQETKGTESFYGLVQANAKEGYYDFNVESPQYIDIQSFNTAQTKQDSYTQLKKAYSVEENERINEEFFDCV